MIDFVRTNTDGDGGVQWFRGDGMGGFALGQTLAATAPADAVHLADLDGDGDLDVLTSNDDTDELLLYANDGSGTFAAAQTLPDTDGSYEGLSTGDFDGDGDLDLLTVAATSGGVPGAHPSSHGTSRVRPPSPSPTKRRTTPPSTWHETPTSAPHSTQL